ncbi:MAG: hypothetical protein ABW217_06045 [Polyangiaceae bacterium]
MTQPMMPGTEPSAPARNQRRSRSFKIVALVLLALFGVAAVGAVVAYYKLLHYERVAVHHIPASAAWAARVDVERVALFEPVRRHLLPLVNRMGSATPAASAPSGRDLATALRQELGLNLGMDLREIVVAGGPGLGDWLVVLGGIFPKRSDLIVRASELLLSQVGVRTRPSSDDLLLFEGAGTALAQADDGSLVFGTSAELVKSALAPGLRFAELGLAPDQGVGGFGVLPASLLDPLVLRVLGSVAATLATIQRVQGRLEPESNGRVSLQIDVHSTTPAAGLAGEVQGWLGSAASLMAFVPGADVAGERALISRATVNVTPENTVRLSSYLEHAEVDRACQSLSTWLAPRLGAQ